MSRNDTDLAAGTAAPMSPHADEADAAHEAAASSGDRSDRFHGMIGTSAPMRRLFSRIRRLAPARGAVLLVGESGTGKELTARAVHAESERADGPFLAVNCAGVPGELLESEFFGHAAGAFTGAGQGRQGLLAEACGGSLLLDEIADMPLALQAKLLRALQDGRVRAVGTERERRVDVRIIAATQRDLFAEARAGRFREDLLYRIEAFTLEIPPLRQRGADRRRLALDFCHRHARRLGRIAPALAPETLRCIERYPFPGNVRELDNAIERAVTFCDGREVLPEHLPGRMQAQQGEPLDTDAGGELLRGLFADGELPDVATLQRRYARCLLARFEGNKRRTAQALGIGRRTLYRWLDDAADA